MTDNTTPAPIKPTRQVHDSLTFINELGTTTEIDLYLTVDPERENDTRVQLRFNGDQRTEVDILLTKLEARTLSVALENMLSLLDDDTP